MLRLPMKWLVVPVSKMILEVRDGGPTVLVVDAAILLTFTGCILLSTMGSRLDHNVVIVLRVSVVGTVTVVSATVLLA